MSFHSCLHLSSLAYVFPVLFTSFQSFVEYMNVLSSKFPKLIESEKLDTNDGPFY